MQNLVVSNCTLERLPGGGKATHFCSDAAEARVFVATAEGQLQCFKDSKLGWQVELHPDGIDGLQVLALNYSLELDAVCASLSLGALVLVHVSTRQVEEVGSVEGGIAAMCWSPDGDILAMITGAGSLLIMNQAWEPLSEVLLVDEAAADTVGSPAVTEASITWRGDGKFFATSTLASGCRSIKVWDRATFTQHSVAEQATDLAAPLCWQPNGRHLYTVQPPYASSSGSVRLYETNGLMHGGFDLLPGTGRVQGLWWSPDSELLAVLSAPSAVGVTTATAQPLSLTRSTAWTLQVWHRSNWHWYLQQERRYAAAAGPPLVCWDEQQSNTLHVLSDSWAYEKLQLQWDQCISDRGTSIIVDGARLMITPLRHVRIPPPMCAVHCVLPDSAIAVAVSTSVSGPDELIAAVLADGRLALLRSVEEDLWEETLEEQADAGSDVAGLKPWVSDVVITDEQLRGSCIRSISWLDANTLLLFMSTKQCCSALLQLTVNWGSDPRTAPGTIQQGPLTINAAGVRAVLAHGSQPGCALLQHDSGAVALYRSSHGSSGLPSPNLEKIPSTCAWLAAVPPLVHAHRTVTAPLLGLTPAGQLFWGSTQVASEVTSFAIRAGGGTAGPALLYTTRASLLYTVYFTQLLLGSYQHRELLAAEQAPEQQQQQQQQQHKLGTANINVWQGEKRDDDMRLAMHAAMKPSARNAAARDVVVRAVEQGSRLVAAPKDDVMVVLQMPRGNLETVCPRALVLAAVTQALHEERFADAWQLASVNRVDLNLVIDYQWPKILQALPAFVQQVPQPGDLCELLFALRPDNVVAPGGMYANIAGGVGPASATAGGSAAVIVPANKVDAVCDGLEAAVEAVPGGRAKYITVIAIAHARKSTRQLDQALACIQQAKEAALRQEQQATTTSATAGTATDTSAEKALKHLLLHVDADELYRVALGMYDLALAYMVIANAQRDPGEYMAELQRFGAIADDKMRRYTIDMHLQRYSSAMQNLYSAGPDHFSQALSLAQDKGLLRLLLGLCPEADTRRLQVLDAYGDSLEAERKHEDAALAYLAAGQLTKAMQSYRAASQWRMVFVMARRLKYSESDIQLLAVQVSDELAASGQPAASAAVLLLYLQDVDNAVSMLAQAKEWREALHTAHCHQRQDLVDTVVAPAAAGAAAGLLQEARESMERLAKYWARLKEVRAKRLAMEALVAADAQEGGNGDAEFDAMTDINSLMTSMSMYTENTHTGNTMAVSSSSGRPASTQGGRRAQPHHKKGKAKGGKIRQGTPQEEASLVELLSKLGPTVMQLEEAGQLGELLVLLGHFADARTLQQELGKWLAAQQEVDADLAANPLPATSVKQKPEQAVAASSKAAVLPEWKWAVLRD